MQTFIYRRLGSTLTEPSQGFIFAPTVFSSETRDLPQLHVSAYKFLYELVGDLIAYPSARRQNPAIEERRPQLQSMCLRSALGIIRTLFSLGVVNRFAEAGALPFPHPPQIGYLERHRLSVRWMIMLASALEKPEKNPPGEPRRFPLWAPFYKDETVWLYNECGVFSLAQGQCFDARALFSKALSLQREIDGGQRSAMYNRILLNQGMCAIDRARLDTASRMFKEIRDHPKRESTLAHIASGYLALVDHIKGHIQLALTGYDTAITALEHARRLRALSIFYRHRADLHRHLLDFDTALLDISKSLHHAEAGAHIDLIHYTRIAESRILLRRSGSAASLKDKIGLLQAAEDYADRMDIARIKCEALLMRGELQLVQGELLLASQFVTRAIRIANLNGLILRRIGGLHSLAEIYRRRGDTAGADRIAARVENASHGSGYHLKTLTKSSIGQTSDHTER